MDIFQAIFLALLQGLTEFLPISSSAHLILPSKILQWPDQGLAFDVAVHVGTLLAVMIYFRQVVGDMFRGVGQSLVERRWNSDARLASAVVVGVLPACLLGLIFDAFIEEHLRSITVIAATTIGFGILLGFADWRHNRMSRSIPSLETVEPVLKVTLTAALLIGFAQALALIPGTSRSGITITAALLLGFSRDNAARFSFLLSIPLILAAGAMKTCQLMMETAPVDWGVILTGTLVAGVSAYLCIHWFLKLLDRIGMMPFVIYRLLLGGLLLVLF